MATIAQELRAWVAAARGALEWHLETGDVELPVPDRFTPPPLGQIAPADVLPPPPADGGPPRAASPKGLRALAEAAGAVAAELQGPRAPTVSRVATPSPSPPTPAPAAADAHPAAPSSFAAPDATPDVAPSAPSAGLGDVSRLTIEAPAARAPAPALAQAPASTDGRPAAAAALRVLRDEIGHCTRCTLSRGRSELVFGAGDPRARLMFVGERPERAEDQVGLPYVDDAGALLGKMVRAMGLQRADVYLTYLVNCFDPDQEADAGLDACAPFIAREIEIVQPEVIIALGPLPAWRLTGATEQLPHLRGAWHAYTGGAEPIPVRVTFPPRALIQRADIKRHVWTDLKHVMRRMGLSRPS